MDLRQAIANCAKNHPELTGVFRAELRKVSRDVKTLNVKFKLNGVKILESYLNEVDDTASGKVAMSGTIGIRMGMGGWREWPFKGVYNVVQAQSGDIDIHNTQGPLLSKDTQVAILLEDILEEEIGGKLADMLARHALKWGNTSESQDDNVPTRFVYKGASTNPAMLTTNQFRYFRGIPGGAGKKVEQSWRSGETCRGYLQKVVENLRKYEEIRQKPGWGSGGDALIHWDEMDRLLNEQEEAVIPTGRHTTGILGSLKKLVGR